MAEEEKITQADTIPVSSHALRGLKETALLLLLSFAVFMVLVLASYSPADPAWSNSHGNSAVMNFGGIAGAWFADLLLFALGALAYLLPVLVLYCAWLVFRWQKQSVIPHTALGARFCGLGLFLTSGCTLLASYWQTNWPVSSGGVIGQSLSDLLVGWLNMAGATLLLVPLLMASITLLTGLSWFAQLGRLWRKLAGIRLPAKPAASGAEISYQRSTPQPATTQEATVKPVLAAAAQVAAKVVPKAKVAKKIAAEPEEALEAGSTSAPLIGKLAKPKRKKKLTAVGAGLPELALLDPPPPHKPGYSEQELEELSRQVEAKLIDFGIKAEVVAVNPGPVITRFELNLAPGVKVSQVSNLSKDLARGLSVVSVRVVEVIPGKPVIGLEIPNQNREIVGLQEILQSNDYQKAKSPVTLALGKDISGHPSCADLAKMPHCLVAGTTGSGKSVAINVMLLSMLFKATPAEVRLILIDPKMLELSVYDDIPHLLAPVVTDMKEAANALRWCVAEMERRYRLMAAVGVRNLAGFNKKVLEAEKAGQPLLDPTAAPDPLIEGWQPPTLEVLPTIVVVIDELADMMMVVGKKVEELIARLAQKARAAGVHLILATQRPSVDVLTGLIKANIPTRIAFQVSSKIDSRTVLDQMGAEALLGHGDMLFLPPGTSLPNRVHGAFVDDHEVHAVVAALKELGRPDYVEEILSGASDQAMLPGAAGGSEPDAETDALYDEAVAIVTETRKASISGVQRRLKIGYNRAARMVEDMEAAGVVGPLQSNGSREVLAPPPVKV